MEVDTGALMKSRSAAKGQFTKARNNLYRLIKKTADVQIIESRFAELKINYAKTQEKRMRNLWEERRNGSMLLI